MKEARNSCRRSLAWEDGHCQVVRTPLTEKYVYGMERISYTNDTGSGYYLYDALGNVRKETTAGGRVTASYRYDSYGNVEAEVRLPEAGIHRPCRKMYGAISGLVMEGLALGSMFHEMHRDLFWGVEPLESAGHTAGRTGRCIPGGSGNRKDEAASSYFPAVMFGYRGEETDRNTGLIYLRYRYYNPATADFISEDSYSGSLERPLSQNKYLYVEGNPLNYKDPSGHKKAWTAAKPAVGIGKGIKNSVVSGTLGKNAGSAAARVAAAAGIQVPVADKVKSVAGSMAGGRSAGTGKKASVGVFQGMTLGLFVERSLDFERGRVYGAWHSCNIDGNRWYQAWEQENLAKVKHPEMFGYGETYGSIAAPIAGIALIATLASLALPKLAGLLAAGAKSLSEGSIVVGNGAGAATVGLGRAVELWLTGEQAVGASGSTVITVATGIGIIEQVIALAQSMGDMVSQSSGDSSDEKPSNKPYKNNKEANKQAEKQGYKDAHELKEDYVGKSNVSKYDMKYDTKTGEIYLESKDGKIQIPTGLIHEP